VSIVRVIAIVMIIAGTLGLVYGGFKYNGERHSATLGPVAVTVRERESVTIPVWAAAGAIAAGALLLLVRRRSERR
jgi:ABC-type thiamin/hydroxymethylpyrimidine transport system permease subunit